VELETILIDLVKDNFSDEELLNIYCSDNYKEIKDRYCRSKKRGVDVHFAEYLYLTNLLGLIGDNKDLYDKLGYDNKKFGEFKQLSSFRNRIAHAGNQIITSPGSVKTLDKRINLIKESIFRLKN